ncbi:hypothetical protein PO909_008902 [Leuciscus waleckii]
MFWSGQILLLKEDHRPIIGFIDYTLWCADPPSFPGGKAIHSVPEPDPVDPSIPRSDHTTRSQESVPSEQSNLEPQWEHWLIDLETMGPVPTQGPMPELSWPQPVPGNFLDEPDILPAPLFRFCPLAPPTSLDTPALLVLLVFLSPPSLLTPSSSLAPPRAPPPPAQPCETNPLSSAQASRPMTPSWPVSSTLALRSLGSTAVSHPSGCTGLPHPGSAADFLRLSPPNLLLHYAPPSLRLLLCSLSPFGVTSVFQAPVSTLVRRASGFAVILQSCGVTMDHRPGQVSNSP